MPVGDKRSRTPAGEARRPFSAPLRKAVSEDGASDIEVRVAASSRAMRKAAGMAPAASGTYVPDACAEDTDAFIFPTSTTTSATMRSSCRTYQAHVAQALQFTLTEPGMALMTAAVLLCIALLGTVTDFFIAPALTTSLAAKIQSAIERASGYQESRTQVSTWMPDVVQLVQEGLQLLLIPTVLISAAGVHILADPERRRPGKWLLGYGLLVLLLGLAQLYLLVRVGATGKLGEWQSTSLNAFQSVAGKIDGEDGQCVWENNFPCSGFGTCCVTNTFPIDDTDDGLLTDDAMWGSMCFATLKNGTALARRRHHGNDYYLEDITDAVHRECGVMKVDLDEEYLNYSTSCAVHAKKSKEVPGHFISCETYFMGHLSSTIGFDMCLLFGMTVCSLVSGVVALMTHHQRPHASGFVSLNTPAHGAMRDVSVSWENHADDSGGGTMSFKRS
ncbi:hypothetical protein NESM_000673900 [Novymonas esmeraldas]|uniref:Uncharacterized protein n=1 Tax=Novymonas esmeraldas TaxID=1808958 RepID=A0AAW0EU88_9TRYP